MNKTCIPSNAGVLGLGDNQFLQAVEVLSGPVNGAKAFKTMFALAVSAVTQFPGGVSIAAALRGSNGTAKGLANDAHGDDVVHHELLGHFVWNGVVGDAEFFKGEIEFHAYWVFVA